MRYYSIHAILGLITCLFLLSCGSNADNGEKLVSDQSKDVMKAPQKPLRLEKVWETEAILEGTECVLFDSVTNLLYVSNIVGSEDILAMDGNGYISQIDLQGNIVNQKWITGLNSPKGLGLMDGKLYISDVSQIAIAEVSTGKIIKRIDVEGAMFLNDISIDSVGVAYFTDSKTNKIHILNHGKVSLYKDLKSPNGLLDEPNRILTTTIETGQFGAFNKTSGEHTVLTNEIGAGDGIASDEKGNYIISSWKGEVFFIDGSTYEKKSLLKTEEQGINTADLTYVAEKNLVIIPTFFTNTVVAYRLLGN